MRPVGTPRRADGCTQLARPARMHGPSRPLARDWRPRFCAELLPFDRHASQPPVIDRSPFVAGSFYERERERPSSERSVVTVNGAAS